MIRTLHGLLWEIQTPSVYKLLSVNDDVGAGGSVLVCFSQERTELAGQWWIVYLQPGRLPVYREFASRDDAMALIASRRGAA